MTCLVKCENCVWPLGGNNARTEDLQVRLRAWLLKRIDAANGIIEMNREMNANDDNSVER